LFIAAAVTLTACTAAPKPRTDVKPRNEAETIALENLQARDRLHDFADFFRSTVSSVGYRIVEESPDLKTRTAVRFWQLRMIPNMYEIINQPDARASTVDVLIYCIQTRQWLENQDPLSSQDARDLVIEAHREFESRAWEMVEQTVWPDKFEEVKTLVEEWVSDNKLTGIDTRDRGTGLTAYRNRDPYEALTSKSGMFGDIQSGLGDTNFELRRLRSEIRRINEFLDMAPVYAAWSAEVLIYDLLDSPYAKSIRDSLATTGEELTELNDTISDLTLRVEQQIPQIRQDLEDAQGPLTEAAENLKRAIDDVGVMLDDAQILATQAEGLVIRLDQAGQTWGQTAAAATALIDQLPTTTSESGEQSLDLASVNELLDKLITISNDNRLLVEEIQQITDPSQADAQLARLDAVLSRAEMTGRSLIRAAALYAAGLVVLAAVFLFGIRKLTAARA